MATGVLNSRRPGEYAHPKAIRYPLAGPAHHDRLPTSRQAALHSCRQWSGALVSSEGCPLHSGVRGATSRSFAGCALGSWVWPCGVLAGAVPAEPLVKALLGPFEQGAPPDAPALAPRLWPVVALEPGEVLVLAKFGCDLVEAAPLAL